LSRFEIPQGSASFVGSHKIRHAPCNGQAPADRRDNQQMHRGDAMLTANHAGIDSSLSVHMPMRPYPEAPAAACEPVMRIAYLGAADLGSVRTSDSLDILVPKETANLFTTRHMEAARDRTAYVRAPLVVVVPPALPHSLADRPGSQTLLLRIAGPFFRATACAALGSDQFSFVELHATNDSLLREVADAVDQQFPSHRLEANFLNTLAALLAAHVARNYLASGPARAVSNGGLAAHKIRCVRTFVAEHLGETIRVEQLAAEVHMSPFHFARMFKQSTEQSPHLYILLQRIKRAKELLAGTDSPIIDVAADVGFRTQGHFTGVFHRYTGFTPKAFRMSARDASIPSVASTAGDRNP
jgi:AraC family transcriptional regulator